MMGRREGGQGQFSYAFDLDKVVPPDHLIRQIDSVIDLSWVHKELASYYSDTGRPSHRPDGAGGRRDNDSLPRPRLSDFEKTDIGGHPRHTEDA